MKLIIKLLLALMLTVSTTVSAGLISNWEEDVEYGIESECLRLSEILFAIAKNRDNGMTDIELITQWLTDNKDAPHAEKELTRRWVYFIYYKVPHLTAEEIKSKVINACVVTLNKT